MPQGATRRRIPKAKPKGEKKARHNGAGVENSSVAHEAEKEKPCCCTLTTLKVAEPGKSMNRAAPAPLPSPCWILTEQDKKKRPEKKDVGRKQVDREVWT